MRRERAAPVQRASSHACKLAERFNIPVGGAERRLRQGGSSPTVSMRGEARQLPLHLQSRAHEMVEANWLHQKSFHFTITRNQLLSELHLLRCRFPSGPNSPRDLPLIGQSIHTANRIISSVRSASELVGGRDAGSAAERQEGRQVRPAGSRVLTVCVDTAATIVDLHTVTRAGLQPRQLLKSPLRRLPRTRPNTVQESEQLPHIKQSCR